MTKITLLILAFTATSSVISQTEKTKDQTVTTGQFKGRKILNNGLDLSNKTIKEISSADFEGLSYLKTLHLEENQIKKLDENIFAKLPDLEILYLNDNQIQELPPNIFKNNRNLKTLSLYGNHIKRIQEGTFDSLELLETLTLNRNELKSLDPKVFSKNGKLKTLYLESNLIRRISEEAFDSLTELEELRLADNVCINHTYVEISWSGIQADMNECYNNYFIYQSSLNLNRLSTVDVESSVTPIIFIGITSFLTIFVILTIIISNNLNRKIVIFCIKNEHSTITKQILEGLRKSDHIYEGPDF